MSAIDTTIDEELAAHLAAEMAHNFDAHGFRVITGRATPPPDGQHPDDDTLWMQAGPDWSAMALQLDPGASPAGGNVSAALDPARRQLENWRSRMRNLWNIAGLTKTSSNASDTDPTDTSAYPYITCERPPLSYYICWPLHRAPLARRSHCHDQSLCPPPLRSATLEPLKA